MNNIKQGFPPVADVSAVVLVLGSMPGEESLRQQAYYAYPRNVFWKIMASLFGLDSSASYREKTESLMRNRIALWDVMQACVRPGSLDSAIVGETIVANDFTSFFRDHPNIQSVFFNGAKAQSEYCKRVLPEFPGVLETMVYARLPSTSPAMAQLSFDEKLAAWSVVKESLIRL